MQFPPFKLVARITEVDCPEHGSGTVELQNGYFMSAWYCGQCDAVYELKPVKMENPDMDAVREQLFAKKNHAKTH